MGLTTHVLLQTEMGFFRGLEDRRYAHVGHVGIFRHIGTDLMCLFRASALCSTFLMGWNVESNSCPTSLAEMLREPSLSFR